jgi:hypothetical protein
MYYASDVNGMAKGCIDLSDVQVSVYMYILFLLYRVIYPLLSYSLQLYHTKGPSM